MSETPEVRRPPVVLIANDQEWSARSLETIFDATRFEIRRVASGREAIEVARAIQPDVVVLDLHMPELDGVEVCRELRADPVVPAETSIIITTSTDPGRERCLDALRAGAWDFYTEPIDSELFRLKVAEYAEATGRVRQARAEAQIDWLTGLYNARGLVLRGSELAAQCRRDGAVFGCLVVAPFLAGVHEPTEGVEEWLAETTADLLRGVSRDSDVVGRLDEGSFAILTSATSAEGLRRVLERLQIAAATLREGPAGLVDLRLVGAHALADEISATPVEDVRALLVSARAGLENAPPGDGTSAT